MRFSVFILIAIVWVLSACEEVVDIPLKSTTPALVIEGNVTNGTSIQRVVISTTTDVRGSSSFNGVSGADVRIISGGGRVYRLAEHSPGVYQASFLVGKPGVTYTLLVKKDGKEYTAVSVMPNPVPFDSLRLSLTTFMDKQNKTIEVTYKDEPDVPNYYRFKLIVNNKPSANIFVYTDDLNDGKKVSRDLYDFDTQISTGDKVSVYMEGIDRNVYRYWLGLSQNDNRGAASTTPANPVSNISNGALGYFSAHNVQVKTTEIP